LDAVILAHLIPVLDVFERGFPEFLGPWLTPVRQQLAIVLAPAILAILACWQLGMRERDRVGRGLRPDASFSNHALRFTGVCWMLPLVLRYGPYNRTFFWSDEYAWLLMTLGFCIFPANFLFYVRLRRLALRLPSRAIARQVHVAMWLTFASIVWAMFPKSLHDPGLIWGLRESPMPAAGAPWSLYDLLLNIVWRHYRFTRSAWFYIGLPAAVSAYTLLVFLQFRLALRRSERAALMRADESTRAGHRG
jgi:hypothetical protein